MFSKYEGIADITLLSRNMLGKKRQEKVKKKGKRKV